MHVSHDGRDLPARLAGASLALGNFDGVHRGHQAVLAAARAAAGAAGRPAGVMVFEPHPRAFFQPDRPLFRLTALDVKLELFAAYGLDLAVVMRFDAALAGMGAGAFVDDILVGRLAIAHAACGFDFHFGKGREGTPAFLRAAAARHGFGVTIVEPVANGGEVYSSSAVRACLAEGRVEEAARMLGYRWFVRGAVAGGDRRGRTIGFPTANIALAPETRLRHGIYAVRVKRGEGAAASVHDAVANFGVRPTFGAGTPLLEVFLFDFSGDLYGETLEVEFVGFIRSEVRFDGVEALVAQMHDDAARARALLAASRASGSPLDVALGFAGGSG